MEPTILAQKVCKALVTHSPGEKETEMLQKMETVQRIWSVARAWDHNPAHLDPSSYILEDLEVALRDIEAIDEWESTSHMQRGNANSLIITSESLVFHTVKLPRVQKKVAYL
ncbi:MAG: hypothetical protein ACYCX4_00430 [Bacillota bacterium]